MGIDYSRLAIPKPEPRWKSKQRNVTAEKKAERECYALVDRRDDHCCRICRKRVGGIGMLQAGHHHHIVMRSRGGQHDLNTVVLLCVEHHHAIHNGELRLEGDANARNSQGQLCGLTLMENAEAGWRVVGHR